MQAFFHTWILLLLLYAQDTCLNEIMAMCIYTKLNVFAGLIIAVSMTFTNTFKIAFSSYIW